MTPFKKKTKTKSVYKCTEISQQENNSKLAFWGQLLFKSSQCTLGNHLPLPSKKLGLIVSLIKFCHCVLKPEKSTFALLDTYRKCNLDSSGIYFSPHKHTAALIPGMATQVTLRIRWRIQNFRRGAPTLKVGVLVYYFAIFCRKLQEN